MPAEHFLYFNNSRIWSGDLVPVRCIWAPRWLRLLSILRRWFCCCWLFVYCYSHFGVCNCSMFCCTLLYVHSSIAVILIGKRELVTLLNSSSWCLVMVECLFLALPWGCLRFVIVVFPYHTHLHFLALLMSWI